MKILYHLRRPPILLGLFGVVWLFAVPYGDFDQTVPFPPEFVLIALSIFLLCMDLIKGKTEGNIHIAMAGLMELSLIHI